MRIPAEFLSTPLAHRGLHDITDGRPENSRAACAAAIAAGYGIEIDLQLSADGVAMVFHDYALERLTGRTGPLRQRSAAELSEIALTGGEEGVPRLDDILALVAGRAPLLIEVKDQDGALGPDVGPLEQDVARALAGYGGPVCVMSFNPHSVRALQRLLPDTPRGLTTCAFDPDDWGLSAAAAAHLREIPDYADVGACFVSHDRADLDRPRLGALRDAGAGILCWTIRSPEQEAAARRVADNITFERYRPGTPARGT